jgi:hypothetical protein
VLKLNPAACVDPDPTDADKPGMRDLHDIQLVLSREQYLQLESMLGRRIGLSGILFPAETGHHHTPVLMEQVQFGR